MEKAKVGENRHRQLLHSGGESATAELRDD